MKIVRIDGGLGNQMFCYAFLIALQQQSEDEVMVDTHRYDFFPNHNGYELEYIFGIKAKEATRKQLWSVTWPANNLFMSRLFQRLPHRKSEIIEDYRRCYPDLISEARDGYYIGNWQWSGYFNHIRPIILKTFKFKNPLDLENSELYKRLKTEDNSVSIHIRRGDYLSSALYKDICTIDYYIEAINKAKAFIKNRLHITIFSNDINWSHKNILPLFPDDEITFVGYNKGKDSYKDMQLMSVCRVNIIANSSFSWWAAYLNNRNDKIVIAPKCWINNQMDYRVQCDEWICI